MGADKASAKSSPPVTEADVIRKFNQLRKYIHNCNSRILHLRKRLHSVTKEVKALKKEREYHMKTVKKAERIERKLDAEKTKLKRKVLKTGTSHKAKTDPRKDTITVIPISAAM